MEGIPRNVQTCCILSEDDVGKIRVLQTRHVKLKWFLIPLNGFGQLICCTLIYQSVSFILQ